MPTASSPFSSTSSDVPSRVQDVVECINIACSRSGRSADEVTLVAVSKTFSSEEVRAVAALGVLDFGENRVQELVQKSSDVPGMEEGGLIRWHMVGHLQRNKVRDVVRIAHLFHALDSLRLAQAIDRRCGQTGRVLSCLIQVNTSGEASKEGVPPEAVTTLVQDVRSLAGIELRGFMTVAAPARDPEQVRHEFRVLREIRDRQREAHPDLRLDFLSMGMSGDFEIAIEEGATHVRLGRRIFGDRS